MARGPQVERFRRVAFQRLEDAELLLENDRRSAAIYLAGYAVECMMKALLISTYPKREHKTVVDSFRGAMGHDVEALKTQYVNRAKGSITDELHRSFVTLSSWSTDLRYDPGLPPLDDVITLVKSATTILDWGRRTLP